MSTGLGHVGQHRHPGSHPALLRAVLAKRPATASCPLRTLRLLFPFPVSFHHWVTVRLSFFHGAVFLSPVLGMGLVAGEVTEPCRWRPFGMASPGPDGVPV